MGTEVKAARGDRRIVGRAVGMVAGLATLLLALSGCGVVGFLRYGLTQARPGSLRVGERAPDAALVTLEGEPRRLHDFVGDRPLVLVFGSFT